MAMKQLFGIQGIPILLTLSILPCLKVQAQELPDHRWITPGQDSQTPRNVKYPNGISETEHSSGQKAPLVIAPDTTPDPTVQIGPGVVFGPGVLIRGKPAENPLLKDAIPSQPNTVDYQ